ncbi:sodium-dependent transporter [Marinobacter lutaoensis]|uniref:Transporter n=1 Tax=Marinobacter lutaoensis TaxID=135739 RepID=A0A1V2DSL4_9GAMM|nr:sodium-dependent transporter [Marinobacter lutaoensis]MBE03214.1 sodium-dependent transporter [Marinobacter sp.]MBI42239.1 sodium-dependent transporter [Oceanospirillales bacterium]NVD36405.1 sodium-dependent transporter [Marinobacter lutaoensis]ONF43688.1 sodium-dependent transporter [Marinobacter lutaoensis]
MAKRHEFIDESRKQWSSEPAFVASMAAAAVGLGNLWRFPYMVGENGGGAFVVAYLLALVVVVLPIMILEVAAGRLSKGSSVHTYRQVNRFGAVYGWFVVAITTAITSYYLVITGWTLGYAVDAATGNLRAFGDFTAGYNSLWYFVLVTALGAVILARDVTAIEWLSKLLMPVLIVVMIGLVFLASRTPGWEQTKVFFFRVDWSRLTDGTLWAFAFGQAFYSLAIGQGYLVTYGSFIPRQTHVPRACLIVAGTETSVALLAGWMIFPFVFSLGMAPAEGSQLAFVTLPRVFEGMAGGYWIGTLFFGLFFLAAFSSSLAGLKVMVAAVAEEFRLSNGQAVAIVTLVMLVLGTASALSFTPLEWRIAGEPVLDVIDRVAGGNVIIFSGVLGAALFCWFIPPGKIRTVLGTETRWWEWRMYLIGRYLPVAMLLWVVVSYALSQVGVVPAPR